MELYYENQQKKKFYSHVKIYLFSYQEENLYGALFICIRMYLINTNSNITVF